MQRAPIAQSEFRRHGNAHLPERVSQRWSPQSESRVHGSASGDGHGPAGTLVSSRSIGAICSGGAGFGVATDVAGVIGARTGAFVSCGGGSSVREHAIATSAINHPW